MLGRYTLSRPIRELGFITRSPFGIKRTVTEPVTVRSPFSSTRMRVIPWGVKEEQKPTTGSTIVSGEAIQAEAVQNAVTDEAQDGTIVNAQPQPDVTPESTVETGPLPEDDSTPSSVEVTEDPVSEDNQLVAESVWAESILEGATLPGNAMVTTGQEVFERQDAERAAIAAAAKKEKTKKIARNVGIGAGIAAAIAAIAAAVR